MEYLIDIGTRAKAASRALLLTTDNERNAALIKIADSIIAAADFILDENAKDIDKAIENAVKDSLIDRLRLTKERITSMADGLRDIALLNNPLGEIVSENERPNGLLIHKKYGSYLQIFGVKIHYFTNLARTSPATRSDFALRHLTLLYFAAEVMP